MKLPPNWPIRVSSIVPALIAALVMAAGPGNLAARADDSPPPGSRSAEELARDGFKPLFDGVSLAGWDVKPCLEGHWVARDGIIDYDGKGEGKRFADNTLWTKDSFTDFTLYAEWRLPAEPELKPQPIVLFNGDFLMEEDNPRQRVTRLRPDAGDSGILMRGILNCQANIWSQELGSGEINGYRTDRKMPQEVRRACIPIKNADQPLGQWNVFEITLQGDRMSVVLNGQTVIAPVRLPDLPPTGPIGLQHHGNPVQFRKMFISGS
ncbi:MAG: 3-keto-disaccharide hydrolase [Thermoguttaceae bacterium]